MNPRSIAYLSIWGLSVGAAYFAGKSLTPTDSAEGASVQATKSVRANVSGGSAPGTTPDSTTSRSSAQARLEAAPMVRKGSSPEEMMADIALSEDPLERTNALLALIDSLDPSQFESVVASFRDLGITRERWGEYRMLLTAWAKVDPQNALTYASENTDGTFARNTILATWAATNPEGAIAWAEANHDNPDEANPWLVGVIEGLAPHDLGRATALMETMPRSRQRGDALESILSNMLARNPEDAKNWSATITDDVLRAGAYAMTAEAIARKDAEEAATWLAGTGDIDALNRVGEDIVEDWYRQSPEAATQWVTNLPPEAISEGAEGVIDNMVREDPVNSALWLSDLMTTHPDTNFDSAVDELVRGSTRRDPELAATWVSAYRDEGHRNRNYHRVLGDWNNQDSQAAKAWMQQNIDSLPNSIRRRFLEQDQQPNNGQ
ncbi:hypothetical protein [Roseibacillus ishigakijimensis]|uniref:Uncharacterized protein n=1 Tax=Roseibacillus ishigakijimensis TaxID=454146 RepID=A0A934RLB0_9BACT|nr:hypothetical protein [Roseibacillus ishigakijimensis]MBK1832855.1 hypothetical protein [Roseibacillus ishigakijimensis]